MLIYKRHTQFQIPGNKKQNNNNNNKTNKTNKQNHPAHQYTVYMSLIFSILKNEKSQDLMKQCKLLESKYAEKIGMFPLK